MTFIHLSEADLAKEGIIKLADVPITNLALWLIQPVAELRNLPPEIRKSRYRPKKLSPLPK